MSIISIPLAIIVSLNHRQNSTRLTLSLPFNTCTDVTFQNFRCKSFLSILRIQPYETPGCSICLSIYLQPFVGALAAISVYRPFTQSAALLGRAIIPSQSRYLHTGQHRHRIKAHRYPCLKWDSNPTIPVFKRAKTVHALDRAAPVISALPVYEH
jgi:hypothetical protein